MEPSRLNQWLTLGANIGVLVGIILLVVELQQNREMMRAQTRTAITAISLGHTDVVASDGELAELLRKGRLGEELSPTESVRYLYHALGTLGLWEHLYFQYRIGLLDRAEFEGETKAFELLARGSTGFRQVWCQFRETTTEEFRSLVNGVYDDLDCSAIGVVE